MNVLWKPYYALFARRSLIIISSSTLLVLLIVDCNVDIWPHPLWSCNHQQLFVTQIFSSVLVNLTTPPCNDIHGINCFNIYMTICLLTKQYLYHWQYSHLVSHLIKYWFGSWLVCVCVFYILIFNICVLFHIVIQAPCVYYRLFHFLSWSKEVKKINFFILTVEFISTLMLNLYCMTYIILTTINT